MKNMETLGITNEGSNVGLAIYAMGEGARLIASPGGVKIDEITATTIVDWLTSRFELAETLDELDCDSLRITVPGAAGGAPREIFWTGDTPPAWLERLATIALGGTVAIEPTESSRLRAEVHQAHNRLDEAEVPPGPLAVRVTAVLQYLAEARGDTATRASEIIDRELRQCTDILDMARVDSGSVSERVGYLAQESRECGIQLIDVRSRLHETAERLDKNREELAALRQWFDERVGLVRQECERDRDAALAKEREARAASNRLLDAARADLARTSAKLSDAHAANEALIRERDKRAELLGAARSTLFDMQSEFGTPHGEPAAETADRIGPAAVQVWRRRIEEALTASNIDS